jgi:hypothetical protein
MTETQERKRVYVSHAEHSHPQTKAARDRCRRMIHQTGEPWDGTDHDPAPGTPEFEALSRGQKAAITRRNRDKRATQTKGVDDLLEASTPLRREAEASVALDGETQSLLGEVEVGRSIRDARGRFTKDTLARWDLLITQMDDARSYIETNGIELMGATLVTSLGGQKFVAEFDGDEWAVTAE